MLTCLKQHSPSTSAYHGTCHRGEGRCHRTRLALLQLSPRPALWFRARTALTRQAAEQWSIYCKLCSQHWCSQYTRYWGLQRWVKSQVQLAAPPGLHRNAQRLLSPTAGLQWQRPVAVGAASARSAAGQLPAASCWLHSPAPLQ